MTEQPTSRAAASEMPLFAVSVRAHGTSWRVLVRAADAEAARGHVASRGHDVIAVAPTNPPRPATAPFMSVCPVCNYSLRGVPPGKSGLVQCPECGMIACEAYLPTRSFLKSWFRMRRIGRAPPRALSIALALGVIVVIALIVMLA